MMMTAPGAIFVGQVAPKQQAFIKQIMSNALRQGFTRIVEPCCGAFAMSHLAVQAGFRPEQIEASDVTLFSSLYGYAIMEKPLDDLEISIEGLADAERGDYAAIMYRLIYSRIRREAGSDYFYAMLRDLELNRDTHVAAFQKYIDRARGLLHGLTYRPLDLFDHIAEVRDDPKTLIVINPPTYKAGYEKWFNYGEQVKWKEPKYGIFDPETDIQRLMHDVMGESQALILCYEETTAGKTAGSPIFARHGSRAGLNVYTTTNHEAQAVALAEGRAIIRANEDRVEKLECSIMPSDYAITEATVIGVKPITASVARYYRNLWTHNFQGGGGMVDIDLGLFADGLLVGVMGVGLQAPMSSATDLMFLIYGITPQHQWLRLHRLMVMLSLSREFLSGFVPEQKLRGYTQLSTTMLTKYPESKEMRGLMKLREKKKGPLGFTLKYRADLNDKSESQVLREFLNKEELWRKNRAAAKERQ